MSHSRDRAWGYGVVAWVAMAWFLMLCTPAFADFAPHVAVETDTDSCAMCHRTHQSASEVFARNLIGGTFNALITGTHVAENGDTELCFTCHGAGSLGADRDVQAEFLSGQGHLIMPDSSTFGPEDKQCSDCHDTHGGGVDASATTPAALLRAKTTTTTVHAGNRYCAVCHTNRPAEIFDGLAIFEQTRHADITPTVSGTSIVCSACHAPHGSPNAPLIVTQLATSSAPATYSVPANDRWLCYGCHGGTQDTYHGGVAYEVSGHGSSDESVSAVGEWVTRRPAGSVETSRAAGECQVCHRPMGIDDGTGTAIPKLAAREGKALCYDCHGIGSVVATDVASADFAPVTGGLEVVSAFGATTSTVDAGRLQVRSRLTSVTTELTQPREFLSGRVGAVASGDIDGDGSAELLVAKRGTVGVAVLTHSPLAGLAPKVPGDVTLIEEAEFIAVADVLGDSGLEVVTATGDTVRTYRWGVGDLDPVLVDGVVTLPAGNITGLATGNVAGTSLEEIVVTTEGPDGFHVLSGVTDELVASPRYATRAVPKGPSIGDIDGDSFGEIAIANSAETTMLASVFDAVGTELSVASDTANTSQHPVSTLLGQVFPGIEPTGTSGAELVVIRDATGADDRSRLSAYVQTDSGGGWTHHVDRVIGNFANPTNAIVGDFEGRGRPQVIIALAGNRSSEASAQAPGIVTYRVRADLTSFDGTVYQYASGSESAGEGAAWVHAADLGDVGPSRHASSAVEGHNSTETVGFSRHVECADCHNVHEGKDTDAAAPAAYGPILGAWGVSVDNAPAGSITLERKSGIDYEYELCLKCHSSWSPSAATRNIAEEFDTRLTSFHGVEGVNAGSSATAGSFVSATPAWSNTSRLHCIDCHGDADADLARGPHYSPSAPLLLRPYRGVTADDSDGLCFRCHRASVYLTGDDDGVAASTSNFYDENLDPARSALHSFHVLDREIGCEGCHASHGSDEEHLMRGDVGWTDAPAGGSCSAGCHTGGATYPYERP